MNTALADLRQIVTRWRVWFLMGNQDIELRYRRSFLGPFWISIAMAAFVGSISLLYSGILHQPFDQYISYFGAGVLAWMLIAQLITEGCQSVLENENNLRAVPIPLPVLAARVVYRNLIIFAHNLLVIAIVLAIFGRLSLLSSPLALLGLLLICVLGIALSLLLGPVSARFRDLPQLAVTLVQILYFLTPIFWAPTEKQVRSPVIELNPLYHLVQTVRGPLLGQPPSLAQWAGVTALVFAVLALSLVSLAWSRRRLFLWL